MYLKTRKNTSKPEREKKQQTRKTNKLVVKSKIKIH